MRLTLRTLLAYLDDTLEASEIKEIGEKVAESDAAQELVARLKQVTRRRRLTAPANDGPEGADSNDVAEYLDNELDSDKVSDLEKRALESDVHLAEIAACHQILTLVLGEPMLVPPKAKERMYGLVRGREANPKKKAQGPKKNEKEAVVDEEELALSSGWLRWVLPAAGAALVLLLALAVYQVLPPSKGKDDKQVAKNDQPAIVDEPKRPGPADKDAKGKDKSAGDTGKDKPAVTPGGAAADKTAGADKGTSGDKPPDMPEVERAPPPSKDSAVVGLYAGGFSDVPAALVTQPEGKDEWRRVNFKEPVSTNDTLLTLPGFSAIVQTPSGVSVMLRGMVRELSFNPVTNFLLDSAVTLHVNPKFDLDMTLQRGRVYLANRKEKGPVKLRLRFEKEVWDVALANPGDEICIDLLHYFTPVTNYRKGEDPKAECYLSVLKGDADVKIDAFHTYNVQVQPPKWASFQWDSFTKARGPFRHDEPAPALAKQPVSDAVLSQVTREHRDIIKRMQAALKSLETQLNDKKTLRDALKETHVLPDPVARVLAIYCLSSIDSIGLVCDSLGEERDGGAADRQAAIYALQRWVSRGPNQSNRLYDEKTGTGLLIDKMYKPTEASRIVQLLHPFLAEELDKDETYHFLARCLRSSKVAIAELGYRNLEWMAQGKIPQGFNAAWPAAQRERYSDDIEKMIEKKQLPPLAKKP